MGWFNALATQSDGKILLGDSGCLRRALTNGLPDTTFTPDLAALGSQPAILAVAALPEGKILVGKRWERNNPAGIAASRCSIRTAARMIRSGRN